MMYGWPGCFILYDSSQWVVWCIWKYNKGDILLGDNLISKIMGCGQVNLLLKDERIKILHRVLHILDLNRNLIYVSKMSDACI
jgi:hypothetical protein